MWSWRNYARSLNDKQGRIFTPARLKRFTGVSNSATRPPWANTRTRLQSMMVSMRWAMVKTVQLLNTLRIAVWISWSVSPSTAAVASSITSICDLHMKKENNANVRRNREKHFCKMKSRAQVLMSYDWPSQKRSSKTKQLALPNTEILPILCNQTVDAIIQAPDFFAEMYLGYGLIDLNICVLLKGIQIQPHCAPKQHRILQHNHSKLKIRQSWSPDPEYCAPKQWFACGIMLSFYTTLPGG